MSRICRLMSIAFALIFVNCTNAEEAAAEKEEEAGDPFEVAMAVVNPENG